MAGSTFPNAAGWKLTLAVTPAGGAGGGGLGAAVGGALKSAAAAALPGAAPAEIKLSHTMFRADVTVSKAVGLDGGRVKLVLERLPFRLIQDILQTYETAQEEETASKAKGSVTGVLKLFWRVGLPYPGLDEAADLIQSALGMGDDDTDVAARFVVTGLSVETDRTSYNLVVEGVDKAWHALSTERVPKAAPLAAPADIKALCEKLGVATGPAGGTKSLLPLPGLNALVGGSPLGGGAGAAGGAPSDGASQVTPRERVVDRLREFESTVVDKAKAEGLGGYLIDNGRLLFGDDVVKAFKADPNDLSGGLAVLSVRAHERDLTDATGAEQAYSLQVRGDPGIKPGQVLKFRFKKQKLASASTGLGYADAAIGLATDPLGLQAEGDPVCLYVRSVRHRQSSKIGFITEVDGIGCGADKAEVPKRSDKAGSGGVASSSEAAAGAIQTAIERRRPKVVDVGEVRAFRSQPKGGLSGQTSDLILGLDASQGRVQAFRAVDLQRTDPQRAGAIPYVTPFAWGAFGLVLPRYPGTRVALLRPEGKPEEALDVGALWWSGKSDNQDAGPATAEDGDYWLILPVDPNVAGGPDDDASAISPSAASASHDLIDAKGRRTVQVRELTLRIGDWTLKAPGDRPADSAAAGGLRIEGKDGTAFIEIDKDGKIKISTPQTLELKADAGIKLSSNNITVNIKDGAMDVT